VVNAHGRLVGCLNVDEVLEYVKESSQRELLAQAGLPEAEDLYAPVIVSARNRWPWLALNLLLAFIASRVIGQFEGTIEKVVALAALMPIIANVGGNAGNQAMALMIRSLALNQLTQGRFRRMLSKEVMIGLLNGLVWGCVMAAVTWLLYGDPILAGVMLVAMVLTLLMAVTIGVLVPYGLKGAGQDPALGSSILITGATDTLGFLIFLGLAALVFGG
jgi:magnesium transporter